MTDRTHENPFRPMGEVAWDVASYWFELPYVDVSDLPMPSGLLVGEQPKPGGNPKLPLWPFPPNSAGARLFQLSGMSLMEYFKRLARVNMSRDVVARWNADWARRRADWILTSLPDGARVVACGAKARNAFGIADWFSRQDVTVDGKKIHLVAIPHPSGRSREYNEESTRARARMWIRWAARIDESS